MKLICSLLLMLVTGFAVTYTTVGQVDTWYATLHRSSLNPPDWIFTSVWTVLYILMGLSFWLVWKTPVSNLRNTAIIIFLVQLLLNFLWSFLFFNMHQVTLALAAITSLWIMIILTMARFRPLSATAVWLLVPHLLWVSFAGILNFYFWRVNP